MPTTSPLRVRLLVLHGVLAVCLGLILLYLGQNMTNALSEVVDVAVAILISAAAFLAAAIADWFVAFSQGTRQLHRLTSYLLGGIAFALAGVFLATNSRVTLQWLVLLGSAHALVFGLFEIGFAWKARHRALDCRTFYLLGGITILFSVLMTILIEQSRDRFATMSLGAYLCFVGTAMFFFARHASHSVPSASA